MLVDGSQNPAASVVVPAYNAKSTVPAVLSALMRQETDLDYQVILVESSGDGTASMVREQFPNVRVIESKKRLFPGAARDLGAEEARGEILLFLDSDCVPESTWISNMWTAHHQWDCAAVAGAILNGNPQFSTSTSSYMNEFSDFFPFGRTRYADYLPSGNISYKMDIFKRYGGFDKHEPMYEDLIFNKLLFLAGEKLLFEPKIRVAHHHRTNLLEYLGHEFRRGRGAAVARRRGLMVGAIWVKYPILAFLATPGLFIRKSTVFPYRLLRAYPLNIIRLLCALPCFYLALIVWHCGFLVDVVSGGEQKKAAECTTS